jgi:transcription elongation GreA/GreB family factor
MGAKAAKYDKQKILAQVIASIRETMEGAKAQEQGYLEEAAGFPSAMESHSDTNRSQYQNMAASSRKNFLRISEDLRELEAKLATWRSAKSSTIGLLSVVETVNQRDVRQVIFIVSGQSSAAIQYSNGQNGHDTVEIRAVSEMAGLGKALMGKVVGDVVAMGPHRFNIIFFE